MGFATPVLPFCFSWGSGRLGGHVGEGKNAADLHAGDRALCSASWLLHRSA